MLKQKLIKRAVAALLIAGALVALWLAWGLPPPLFLIEHGGSGGPTGRTREIAGIRFIEISSGYFRSECDGACEPGDLLGKLLRPLDLPIGIPPRHNGESCGRGWVEIPHALWVAESPITTLEFAEASVDPQFPPSDGEDRWLTWSEAKHFCRWLSESGGVPGARLTTGDEWEYLCFAGRSQASWADDLATQKSNPWGIRRIGRTYEWCEDRFDGRAAVRGHFFRRTTLPTIRSQREIDGHCECFRPVIPSGE